MRYRDRVVVVTGVGRKGQVGAYLASAFAREGAMVIAVDRDEAQLRDRVEEMAAEGLDVRSLACDLTSADDTIQLAESIRGSGAERVHALVNAAGGYAPSGPLESSDPTVWERQRAINFDTAHLATRALLPLLRPGGAVIFFAAAAALPGGRAANNSAYIAAKSALLGLMHALTAEEAPHGSSGVRANALAPTAIRTAANIASMGDEPSYVELDEVAELVLHLCSDAGRPVRGQVLRLG
jgi:NAD(P)-dependent dehydrogenase (short-subunit alcohol dehydrogenase family)